MVFKEVCARTVVLRGPWDLLGHALVLSNPQWSTGHMMDTMVSHRPTDQTVSAHCL